MDTSFRRVIEVYVFVYSFFIASRPLSDGDFWWHLKTGEYIFSHHSIPRVDIYSFTNLGKPWIAHEWLSELIIYIVYSRFGSNALIFIFAVLIATAFWIIYRQLHAHPFLAGFSTLLGVLSILTNIGVRPRVFTILFASIYLAVLQRYLDSNRSRALWWLIALMALWVNLHAGYIIGFVLIGVSIVGVFADAYVSDVESRLPYAKAKNLILVFVGTALAANLNPHGARIFWFPFEFFLSPVQQNTVDDWLSPNFHQAEMLPLALLILLSVAAISLSPRRIKPSQLLLFLGTLYATLKSQRHVAIFALVAVPLIGNYGQACLDNYAFGKSFRIVRTRVADRRALVFGVLLALPLFAFVHRLKTVTYSIPSQQMVGVPVKAVEFLKQNRITGNTFTDPNIWSGYLIWAMPSNPVYVDGRIDMYGDQFVSEYLRIVSGQKDWRDPFDHYFVRVAIVSHQSILKLQFEKSSEWKRVYQDEMSAVFTRIMMDSHR